MNNPFLTNDYLRLEASINKVMLIDIKEVTDDIEIEGKSAFEVFSTEKIIEEIKKQRDKLELNESIHDIELPKYLNHCLEGDDSPQKEAAVKIAEKFGKRLGVALYILKRGMSKSALERKDWGEKEWEYWGEIENIILTGGLSSSMMGEYFRKNIYEIFEKSGLPRYNILLTNNSGNAGAMGAAMFINEEAGANLVFDFGQSYLKRSIAVFEKEKLVDIINLEKRRSIYMEWDMEPNFEHVKYAKQLDEYLQEAIIETCLEAAGKKIEIGNEIIISVANYIMNGKFINRGGYGKLGFIADNYEKHLSMEIERKIGRKFQFKVVHDGTANAANFMNVKNGAVISLGTAFGIGFTNSSCCNKKISDGICILRKEIEQGQKY